MEITVKYTRFHSGHFKDTSIRMTIHMMMVYEGIQPTHLHVCAIQAPPFSPLLNWVKLWDWEIYGCGHWAFHILQPVLATCQNQSLFFFFITEHWNTPAKLDSHFQSCWDAKYGCKCEGMKCNPTPQAVDLILTSYPRAKISGIALH